MPRRRKLSPEDIPEVNDRERNAVETLIPEIEEVKTGSVVYESDIRAGTHSNGWASDLLGSEINDPPSDPPDEPGDSGHSHGENKLPDSLRYILAGVYLAFGIGGVYVGLTMLRDLRKEKNGT